jgi:uncharacterized protein (TIGR02301 family)
MRRRLSRQSCNFVNEARLFTVMMASRSVLTSLLTIVALALQPGVGMAERSPQAPALGARGTQTPWAATSWAETSKAETKAEAKSEAKTVFVQVAVAEGEGEAEDPAAATEPPSGAPYMPTLARLSSILGSVHFLRRLCGDGEAEIWRDKMNEILVTLSPNAADRQILVAAFNDGFRAFESTYRNCTPAARVALARYQGEGASLSREISARYGN